jgi:hypothetical protein
VSEFIREPGEAPKVTNTHLDIAYNWIREKNGHEPYYADVYALAKKLRAWCPDGANNLTWHKFEVLMNHGLQSIHDVSTDGCSYYRIDVAGRGSAVVPGTNEYFGTTIFNAFVSALYAGEFADFKKAPNATE